MHEFRGYFVVLAVSAAMSAACGGGRSEQAEEAEAMKAAAPNRVQPDGSIRLTGGDRAALGLTVQPAAEGDLPNTTLRFGRVVSPADSEAQVVAPVTGRIMRPPRVQLGGAVAAGTLLMEIQPALDTPERITVGTEAAVRQGDIDAAQRELTKVEADAARARALSPQIVSAAQLQQAETTVATARAKLDGLQAARAAETTARTQAVDVAAPIAGTIAELTATVGALVNRGDLLARIVRAGPLWIDVSVPPDDPVGDRYEVVTPVRSFPVRLVARGRLTDTGGTRTDRLAVDAAASATLTPGATVSVQIGSGTMRGIVLPESAIVPGVENDSVFVEASPGMFVQRPVQVAARFGGQVRLATGGIKPGETVVIRGGMALQGESVRSQLHPAG